MTELGQAVEQRRRTLRQQVSAQEWQARVELAACYRLAAHFGMTDSIYNHISLRAPDRAHEFLINAFGLLFEEVCASNLVRVDLNGNSTDDGLLSTNRTGFVIHAAVHRARADAACVFHTHTRAGTALSCLAQGLQPVSQQALRFYGRIGYHDYEGLSVDLAEQARIVADLGPHQALVLRNHGLLVVGDSVARAFQAMLQLEQACRIQLDAEGVAEALCVVPDEVARRTAGQLNDPASGVHLLEWHAWLRKLDRMDDSYKN